MIKHPIWILERALSALLSVMVVFGAFISIHAEHGKFDQSPVKPSDEAYIFTPPGFQRAGQAGGSKRPKAARLNVTICDLATGQADVLPRRTSSERMATTTSRRTIRLLPYSLTGTWPERLAGNRPSKAPIRYFGHFFYTPRQVQRRRAGRAGADRSLERI